MFHREIGRADEEQCVCKLAAIESGCGGEAGKDSSHQ